MGKANFKETVLRASEGIVSTLTDLILSQIFFGYELALGNGRSPRAVHEAMEKANIDLSLFNYQQIKRALYHLKKKGLIKYIKKEKVILPKITADGRKRLGSLLPDYKRKRIWDRRIYLVSYDIPEKKKRDRDVFRQYLKKISCGMLQASVWLTPYNPKKDLREFVESRGLAGQVLISDLGEDGNVGEEGLKELIARVYNLSELNVRYLDFIREWQPKSHQLGIDKARTKFSFLSILSNDPQLPFELLPEEWAGDKAYKLFLSL